MKRHGPFEIGGAVHFADRLVIDPRWDSQDINAGEWFLNILIS